MNPKDHTVSTRFLRAGFLAGRTSWLDSPTQPGKSCGGEDSMNLGSSFNSGAGNQRSQSQKAGRHLSVSGKQQLETSSASQCVKWGHHGPCLKHWLGGQTVQAGNSRVSWADSYSCCGPGLYAGLLGHPVNSKELLWALSSERVKGIADWRSLEGPSAFLLPPP